jgi:transposase-like protein
VDKAGQTIDFRLSRTRDVAAAKAFFKKAVRYEGRLPPTITLDGYAASHRAVREL